MKVTPLSQVNRMLVATIRGCFFSYILLIAITIGAATPVFAGGLIEIAELLAHPEQYDHLDVMVTGKVMNVQLATNRQGQPAYGFLLQDPAGTLKVVSLGQVEVHEGDQVIVEGVFSRLRQVGRKIVYNEIKALSVRPLTRMNPDLVG
ncbi:MAG: hypothetical protein IPM58_03520 [Nitrospira sp.]|nr:hypothetical protein [Nitrospira sp.]